MIIEAPTIADLARKTNEAIVERGKKVKRYVGGWALQKEGYQVMHELHNVLLVLTNPLARWNSRVNAGILTETEDYFLGLNPGFTHLAGWKFYGRWRTISMKRYPYTYGARIFGEISDDINQWEECMKKLRMSPTTRHACISLWRPIDLLRDFVPCNVFWHFKINEEGELDMITVCRSQDAFRGLFLDCFAYTHFHEQMCLETNLLLGKYTVFEMNVHIYDKDMKLIDMDFAKPKHPYNQMKPTPSPLLTIDTKRKLYNSSKALYYGKNLEKTLKIAEKLPPYWRDWKYFQVFEAERSVISTLDFQIPDIRWTFEERLKQLERRDEKR